MPAKVKNMQPPPAGRTSAFAWPSKKSVARKGVSKTAPPLPRKAAPTIAATPVTPSKGGGNLRWEAPEKTSAKRKRIEEDEELEYSEEEPDSDESEDDQAASDVEDEEHEVTAPSSMKAGKSSNAVVQRGDQKTKSAHEVNELHEDEDDGLCEYERKRLENIRMNEKILQDLGIQQAVAAVTPKKHKTKPAHLPKTARDDSDDESDWSADGEDDDEEAVLRQRRKKGAGASRVLPGRAASASAKSKGPIAAGKESVNYKREPRMPPKSACEEGHDPWTKGGKAALKNSEPQQEEGTHDVVGRPIKVKVFTADVGREEWHKAEIIQYRRRKGKNQHLVRWLAEGEEDEWLTLAEECYKFVEEEDDDSKDTDYRQGDVVVTMVEGDNGVEKGYARLLEKGEEEGVWKVHWLYLPENVPDSVIKSIKNCPVDRNKEVFFSAHQDVIPQDSIASLADIVFTAANFRTTTKEQMLCRYVYDFERKKLHKLSDSHKWINSFARILAQLIGKGSRKKGQKGRIDAIDAVAEAAADNGAGSKGPAMSDSEDEQAADSDVGENVEEGAAAGEGAEPDEADEVHMEDWEGGLCAAGGYLAAVAAGRVNKQASTAWRDVATASEEEVAECFSRLPKQCAEEMEDLHMAHVENFGVWHRRLLAGFSMLFYGFGSKLAMAREFALRECTEGPVVEVNGYVAGLKLQKVLDDVCVEILGCRSQFRSVASQADLIIKSIAEARVKAGLMQAPLELEAAGDDKEEEMREDWMRDDVAGEGVDEDGGERSEEMDEGEEEGGASPGQSKAAKDYVPDMRLTRGMASSESGGPRGRGAPTDLYFLVHNIESQALKGREAQQALARLAAAPGVHLAATIDDVNACLMWDPVLRSTFNFASADLTTFARYVHEAPYASGGAAGGAAEDQTRSALVVMRSLNSNARGIFGLLIKEQIEGRAKAGMTLATLFEVALKGHLAELRDHKLLRERRAADGSQVLYVPMSSEALRLVWAEIRSTAKST